MTAAVQEELRVFATKLLERRGALVEWAPDDREGSAVLTPEVAHSLGTDAEMVRLTDEPGSEGLCVNLATDFLEVAGRLLESESRVGAFRVRNLYLKRKELDEAIHRTFTWLNAKVKLLDTRATSVEYHTWWFHAAIASEDRWETRFSLSLNAASGVTVDIPDPLGLWELEPRSGGAPSQSSTFERATASARARLLRLAGAFFDRMDARLVRDQKRLRGYYNALLREADAKKARGNAKPDPEQREAKKRAVHLELRRKLSELEERYAMEATLQPVVLIRTEVPVLAVDLLVYRKKGQRKHTLYWNPLLKQFEPLACSRCGKGTFAVAFTNEDVAPRCAGCGID